MENLTDLKIDRDLSVIMYDALRLPLSVCRYAAQEPS